MNIDIIYSNKSFYDYCRYDELSAGNQVLYDTGILYESNVSNDNSVDNELVSILPESQEKNVKLNELYRSSTTPI